MNGPASRFAISLKGKDVNNASASVVDEDAVLSSATPGINHVNQVNSSL